MRSARVSEARATDPVLKCPVGPSPTGCQSRDVTPGHEGDVFAEHLPRWTLCFGHAVWEDAVLPRGARAP